MNYEKIYNDLINKRKFIEILTTNKKDPAYTYIEKHHILPKSNNGSDDKDNLVYLKPREHYIAHLLLWQISKMKYGIHSKEYYHYMHAIKMMRLENDRQKRTFKVNNRLYEKMKIEYRNNPFSEETRKLLSDQRKGSGNPMFGLFGKDNPGYGSKRTPEQKCNMKMAQKKYFETHEAKKGKDSPSYGRTPFININTKRIKYILPEEVEKYELDDNWEHYHQVHTQETKRKLSEQHKGKKLTSLHKNNIGSGIRKLYQTEHGKIVKEKISNSISKLIWISNANTKETIRIKPEELSENGKYKPSDGWKNGRFNASWRKNHFYLISIDDPTKKVFVDKSDQNTIDYYLNNRYIEGSSRSKYVKVYNPRLDIIKDILFSELTLYENNGWIIGKCSYVLMRKSESIIKILSINEEKFKNMGYKQISIHCGSMVKKVRCYNSVLDVEENLNLEFVVEYEKLGWKIKQ